MNEWSESMSVCLSRRDLTSFSQSMSPSRLWPRRLTNTHTHLRPASTDSPVQPGQAPTHKQKRPSPSHSTETKLQTQPAPAVCLSVCLSACVSRRWITSRCGSDRVEELVELEDVIGAAREQTHDGTLCVLHDFGEVGQRRGWTQRLYLPQPVDPDGSTAKELLKGTLQAATITHACIMYVLSAHRTPAGRVPRRTSRSSRASRAKAFRHFLEAVSLPTAGLCPGAWLSFRYSTKKCVMLTKTADRGYSQGSPSCRRCCWWSPPVPSCESPRPFIPYDELAGSLARRAA
mmetsp:Transcript_6471/g.18667  ORF Transcript_6471/g.18667 Transcript_6471/m.18667 type:complete len:289 (+) Transcript_6471:86-952(+)